MQEFELEFLARINGAANGGARRGSAVACDGAPQRADGTIEEARLSWREFKLDRIHPGRALYGRAKQAHISHIVEDRVDIKGQRRIPIGTKVEEDILTTDPDTLFPLQGALGYEITHSLFYREVHASGRGRIRYPLSTGTLVRIEVRGSRRA
jgi:hypothetical protein